MKVFITGGSGFMGTNLIEDLLAHGHDVVNYDISPPRNKLQSNCWLMGDILELSRLKQGIEKFNPNFIVHLAARTDLDGRSILDYAANTDGVSNVIESLDAATSLSRVLFASSRLVCEIGYQPKTEDDYLPTTPYGESKVIGEQIIRERSAGIICPWMIFRPTSIWGPWFGVPYKDFFMMILNGRYVHPAKKRIRKSFGYIGNSVYMINKLLLCEVNLIHGNTLYLTDYPELEVKSWADMIAKKSGNKPPREIQYIILKLAAICGDTAKLFGWENPPLTSFRLDNLLTEMLHDTNDLKEICGKLPFSVERGIEETLAWINSEK